MLLLTTKDTYQEHIVAAYSSTSHHTQHNLNELKVVLTNCEGVTSKSLLIENLLISLEPDIFRAVKSKFDKDVWDAEFLPLTTELHHLLFLERLC